MTNRAPVLTDLKGVEFTEGDRVVYSATNGIRVGIVDFIKDITLNPTNATRHVYRVYILMDEHLDLEGPGKMKALKVGYEYRGPGTLGGTFQHFLKIPHLTGSSK